MVLLWGLRLGPGLGRLGPEPWRGSWALAGAAWVAVARGEPGGFGVVGAEIAAMDAEEYAATHRNGGVEFPEEKNYTFKPAGKVLLDEKGGKIRLTEKETSILKYLYRAGEKPVSREEAVTNAWDALGF